VRETVYSIRHCPTFKSKVRTLLMQITRLEKGLVWHGLYCGPINHGGFLDTGDFHFEYVLEINEEEWTGRQEVLVIREYGEK